MCSRIGSSGSSMSDRFSRWYGFGVILFLWCWLE
jgi:hypothetical protein